MAAWEARTQTLKLPLPTLKQGNEGENTKGLRRRTLELDAADGYLQSHVKAVMVMTMTIMAETS